MNKRTSLVAFITALVVQVLIVAVVPARKVFTLATGKPVVLKVQPVDPYSILSGYYVTLAFDISRVDAFPNARTLPEFRYGASCYAVVEKAEDGTWKPVSLERELSSNLPENLAALLGKVHGGQIRYGIEEFYIPETQRESIAEDLGKNPDNAHVEVKVDRNGHAALVRLIIEDRIYE